MATPIEENDVPQPPIATGPIVVCRYHVRPGGQAAFEVLLEQHTPTLRRLGLITDRPVEVLRQSDSAEPCYVEVFEWASDDAAARAAEVPDVIAIWEPMGAICESRDGHQAMEFPLFDRIELHP